VPNRISGYKPAGSSAPVKGPGGSIQAVEKSAGEGVAAPAAAPAADQVTFTGPALALQKLGAAVANTPVVNAQKVAAVKLSVQNGTYKIDAGSVADKILQFERGLK
jgi:negative regulator of flagellin synthesis FlgM